MSHTCKCPNPPGGQVSCSRGQLAICGYRNGKIVSGCFDRPAQVQSIRSEVEQTLATANWILSRVIGVPRLPEEEIGPDLIDLLGAGRFVNEESGEIVNFNPPRDFNPKLLVRSRPMAR